MTFEAMWRELAPIGRVHPSGGYRRSPFASAERECASWFEEQAAARGLDIERDGQGNTIAWWRIGPTDPTDARGARKSGVLIGSHLDSVVDGGAFDGPLGVVSSFAAIDRLRADGFAANRPIGVAMFVEEEGSRFGIACLGSRLATGLIEPAKAAALVDRAGTRFDEAIAAAGLTPTSSPPAGATTASTTDVTTGSTPPGGLGTSDLLSDVAVFVELHVEQGRDLVDRDAAVGLASASWAHGRWRFDFTGEANHAGSTRLEDRHDPMLTYAMTALAANKQARLAAARATFGRIEVEPNATNAIPSRVTAWLDARGANLPHVEALVDQIRRQADDRGARDGTLVAITAESLSPTVDFDEPLTNRLARLLGSVPVIPTGAGHDAAILQSVGIESAMLFVRNPTGISHSPDEFADTADCLAGVDALVDVLRELAA